MSNFRVNSGIKSFNLNDLVYDSHIASLTEEVYLSFCQSLCDAIDLINLGASPGLFNVKFDEKQKIKRQRPVPDGIRLVRKTYKDGSEVFYDVESNDGKVESWYKKRDLIAANRRKLQPSDVIGRLKNRAPINYASTHELDVYGGVKDPCDCYCSDCIPVRLKNPEFLTSKTLLLAGAPRAYAAIERGFKHFSGKPLTDEEQSLVELIVYQANKGYVPSVDLPSAPDLKEASSKKILLDLF